MRFLYPKKGKNQSLIIQSPAILIPEVILSLFRLIQFVIYLDILSV